MPRWRVEADDAKALSGGISTFRMSEPRHEFLEQTRSFWQKRTDRPLSLEDARQIASNVAGVFQVLAQWAEAEDRRHPNPPQEAAGR
jgi:hypothetical protein